MRDLLNFFLRHSTLFLLLVYVVLSCMMIFSSNPFHNSVYLTSANAVTCKVNGIRNEVTGYFGLRAINASLMQENARLENEVLNLRQQVKELRSLAADSLVFTGMTERFDYVTASVINNSTRHKENYFTIDKGSQQGIEPGMGVADHNGVVGIVDVVTPNTSRVISLLYKDQPFTAKIKDTQFVGSVSWKGTDPKTAYLSEIPRHATFHTGDTVVTSGFSTTFPEGIMLGVVQGVVKVSDDNFYTLKIRLVSDFSNLGTVRVIKDSRKKELDSLQPGAGDETNSTKKP